MLLSAVLGRFDAVGGAMGAVRSVCTLSSDICFIATATDSGKTDTLVRRLFLVGRIQFQGR